MEYILSSINIQSACSHHRRYLGSGIDSRGRVFELNGQLYREIDAKHASFYSLLIGSKSLMDDLCEIGLVDTKYVGCDQARGKAYLWHQRIPFISYWMEWPFDMLKDSALLTLRLNKRLLKEGMCLRDGHPYNVLYTCSRPVFIDICSIMRQEFNQERLFESSYFGEYFIPIQLLAHGVRWISKANIMLERFPITKDRIYRWIYYAKRRLAHSRIEHQHTLKTWENSIRNATISRVTEWQDYYKDSGVVAERPESYTAKERSALEFLRRLRGFGANTLLDAGCNRGWFSRRAANMGYSVVACDIDEGSVNNLYCDIRGSGIQILPLLLNVLNPTPAHGAFRTWPKATDRIRCDVVLGMSLVHHMGLSQGCTFDRMADAFAAWGNEWAIVEFIDPSDIHVRHRAMQNPAYTEAEFVKSMQRIFDIEDMLPSNPSTRTIYLFRRRH
jgi:hypothetical protein